MGVNNYILIFNNIKIRIKIEKDDSNNQLILYDDGNFIFQEEIKLNDYNLILETYQKAIKSLNNYKL